MIAVSGHNFPLFEMLELERAWLFSNHFRLNKDLWRAAEIGRDGFLKTRPKAY